MNLRMPVACALTSWEAFHKIPLRRLREEPAFVERLGFMLPETHDKLAQGLVVD